MKARVFISYARSDAEVAQQIAHVLDSLGIVYFQDTKNIEAGADFSEDIAGALDGCSELLIIVSKASARSTWVTHELGYARALKKSIIPFMKEPGEVPSLLSRYHVVRSLDELQEYFARSQRPVTLLGDAERRHKWRQVRVPSDEDFADITFTNDGCGWIVGRGGTLLHTTDGGSTWQRRNAGTSRALYSVAFHGDGVRGCITGEHGVVLETLDRGQTWTARTLSGDKELRAVAMCGDDSAMCIVGSDGVIFRGRLGEPKWRRIRSATRNDLWSVHFEKNGAIGCAVGANGSVLVSDDGGKSWCRKETKISSALYSGTTFSDGRTMCVVGDEGRLLVSRNRGDKWHLKPKPDLALTTKWDNWLNASDVSPNSEIAWVVGTKGIMLNSRDGGESWETFRNPDGTELVCVAFQDETLIWVVGQAGTLLRTY